MIGLCVLGAVRCASPSRRCSAPVDPAHPFRSPVVWRHAALAAVGAGALSWVALQWDMPHGYWAVLTLGLVFCPVPGETWRFAWNRTLGTLTGAVFAGLVALLVPRLGRAAGGRDLRGVDGRLGGLRGRATADALPHNGRRAHRGAGPRRRRGRIAAERLVPPVAGAVVAVGLAMVLHGIEARR
jgi:Fusaric acid resistance protein-like